MPVFRRKRFDPFRIYEVTDSPSIVLRVTVLCGRNITKGFISDHIDTPDPYIQLEVVNNPCGIKKTKTKVNNKNPEWNETFTFVLNPKQENILVVKVRDKDVVTADDTIYKTEYNVSRFSSGTKQKLFIRFKKNSEVELEVLKDEQRPKDVRFGLNLCPQELKIIAKRKEKVYESLQKLLGEDGPQTMEEVPNIAVMGSGGGFRAMVCYNAAFRALQQMGVLDTALYSAVLSGSGWYQGVLYSHPDGSETNLDDLQETLFQNLIVHNYFNFHMRPDNFLRHVGYLTDKKKRGQPTSFTDMFGDSLKETFLADRPEVKFSDQRPLVESAEVPFPLYSAINVKKDTSEAIYHDWVEFHPWEIGIPKFGVWWAPEKFGNKFYMGNVIQKYDEFPLHFLFGMWGCAYAICFSRLLGDEPQVAVMNKSEMDDIQEQWKTENTKLRKHMEKREKALKKKQQKRRSKKSQSDVVHQNGVIDNVDNNNDNIVSDVFNLNNENNNNDGSSVNCSSHVDDGWVVIEIDEAGEVTTEDKPGDISINCTKPALSIKELVLKNILDSDSIKSKSKLSAIVHNTMLGLNSRRVYPFKTVADKAKDYGEIFENYDYSNHQQYMIDAGVIMNSPFPLVLRPQRKIDIILSFDFSDREKGDEDVLVELLKAQTWIKVHRIPFPEINEQEAMKDGVKECYLFEDTENSNCPIVLHFPLVNHSFRRYKAPGVKRETIGEINFADYELFGPGQNTFGTFNTEYSRTKFDRLTKLTEYNTLVNEDLIKDTIKRVIQRKRKENYRGIWDIISKLISRKREQKESQKQNAKEPEDATDEPKESQMQKVEEPETATVESEGIDEQTDANIIDDEDKMTEL